MTRTAGAPIGCQRPSRFWGLGCPKIYHEAEDTLVVNGIEPEGAEFGKAGFNRPSNLMLNPATAQSRPESRFRVV
ncbi:hypothetical protein, partial [Thiolapillus sp.]|uniref:hypothetical protein n=1 Tax=Thiolapillus sp. TaxID=2017437 RepID=UPI003AF5E91B